MSIYCVSALSLHIKSTDSMITSASLIKVTPDIATLSVFESIEFYNSCSQQRTTSCG